MRVRNWYLFAIAGAALASVIPASASADVIADTIISTNLITITATDGIETATWQQVAPINPGDNYTWSDSSDHTLWGNLGTDLGTIEDVSTSLIADPAVLLNFTVRANNSTTAFTITAATVGFGALVNPKGMASAAITVTDGNANGATLTGTEPGVKAYGAFYGNGNTANNFAYLVSPVVAPVNGSNTGSENYPPTGDVVIPGTVNQITSEFKFTLTARDRASGTSTFDVQPNNDIPEPVALPLLSMGAVMFLRRRTR